MRVNTALRLDPSTIDAARRRAGLPATTPRTAVIRYALAVLAGDDTATALDCTSGRGSVSYRRRRAA